MLESVRALCAEFLDMVRGCENQEARSMCEAPQACNDKLIRLLGFWMALQLLLDKSTLALRACFDHLHTFQKK